MYVLVKSHHVRMCVPVKDQHEKMCVLKDHHEKMMTAGDLVPVRVIDPYAVLRNISVSCPVPCRLMMAAEP
jgi:hypothetical protein